MLVNSLESLAILVQVTGQFKMTYNVTFITHIHTPLAGRGGKKAYAEVKPTIPSNV